LQLLLKNRNYALSKRFGRFSKRFGTFQNASGSLKPKFRSFLFQIETKQRVSSRGARWKSPEAEWRQPDARCSLNWIPVSTGMTGALLPVSRTPEPLNREPLKLSANARPVFAKARPFI
jgi:hypothetical protein